MNEKLQVLSDIGPVLVNAWQKSLNGKNLPVALQRNNLQIPIRSTLPTWWTSHRYSFYPVHNYIRSYWIRIATIYDLRKWNWSSTWWQLLYDRFFRIMCFRIARNVCFFKRSLKNGLLADRLFLVQSATVDCRPFGNSSRCIVRCLAANHGLNHALPALCFSCQKCAHSRSLKARKQAK